MNLSDIKSKINSIDKFKKVNRRIRKNSVISSFYRRLAEDDHDDSLTIIADNVDACCKYWDIDYYRFQGVKDILRTNLCHNKFCDNCQNAKAIQRQEKFAPLLDLLAKKYSIFHVVFTVPNCTSSELRTVLDSMNKNFKYIIRYLSGNAKIKGIEFKKFGFAGAVRALEITKGRDHLWHPHFHCLFVLKKDVEKTVEFKRRHVNSYSFNNQDVRTHKRIEYGAPQRYFSDFEVLLQKIWRLKIDGVKVTRDNLEGLSEGYSVVCDPANGHYHEVFKYATKGIFSKATVDEDSYRDFVLLYHSLYKKRIIQGYGILFSIQEEDVSLAADNLYLEIIAKLKEIEEPTRIYEWLDQINQAIRDSEVFNVTYISRSSVAALLGDDFGDKYHGKNRGDSSKA